MTGTTLVSRLECGHLGYFSPKPAESDIVYCRDCRKYKRVVVAALEWRWSCRSCHYGRAYGLDEHHCRTVAYAHLTKYPHHEITVRNGADIEEQLQGPQDEQLNL